MNTTTIALGVLYLVTATCWSTHKFVVSALAGFSFRRCVWDWLLALLFTPVSIVFDTFSYSNSGLYLDLSDKGELPRKTAYKALGVEDDTFSYSNSGLYLDLSDKGELPRKTAYKALGVEEDSLEEFREELKRQAFEELANLKHTSDKMLAHIVAAEKAEPVALSDERKERFKKGLAALMEKKGPKPGSYNVKYEEVGSPPSQPLIVMGFPGVGKSWCSVRCGWQDSDSSFFSKTTMGDRNPDWPSNYIDHLKKQTGIVMASTHKEVREAVIASGLPFVVVHPQKEDKEVYMRRYAMRGSSVDFIRLLDDNWDAWIDELEHGPNSLKLGERGFLWDVVPLIEAMHESPENEQ